MKKQLGCTLILTASLIALNLGTAHAEGETATAPKALEPFAFGDFSWLNGNSRQTEFQLDGNIFSGQFTLDANYVYDFAKPKDHTLTGSTNSGRAQELQVTQLGVGGDFHYQNVRGRLMTQFGLYSTMTPRNDASPTRGQWNLADAYRYISEASGGYHWDVLNGVNLDVGIFMSYVGLESYYSYENWNYQMSYVSANTPWFFNGMRLQVFPSDKVKIEAWLVNGWQAYGQFNEAPGFGWQVLWRPTTDWSFVTNEYLGHDTFNNNDRLRLHSDSSAQYRYYENQTKGLSKAAASLTVDVGCESGGGVSCLKSSNGNPIQNFIGIMAYNRFWFDHDHYGLTLGGGAISNPGRYLVLYPPINGATAATTGNYFTANPGDPFRAWDASATFDYMPSQFITFRLEYIHRQTNTPYFAGHNGITPDGGNQGAPGSLVPGFTPDLNKEIGRAHV